MTRRVAVNPKKLRPYDAPARRRRSLIPSWPDSAAAAFLVASAMWLALAAGIGLLAVAVLIVPFGVDYPLGVFDLAFVVNPMRLEYAFVNATVFGWLSNAGFAAICFITPRLVGRRLALEPLLMLAMLSWNGALLAGVASLYIFDPRPHSALTAMFWLFDGGMAFAAFLVALAFIATAASALLRAYVSAWFAGISLLGLMGLLGLDALVGLVNVFIPLPELAIGLGSAFVERSLPAMWLLGITLAVLHYVVPRAIGLPVASWGLGLLSFLTWLALAPLTGLAGLLDPVIPFFVTTIGAVATMLLLIPVTLAVVNLVMTIQGRWTLLFGAGAAAMALVSLAFLMGTSLIAAIGSLWSIRLIVLRTDWEVGLFVWAAFGAFGFAALSLADHSWPRILRRAWRENALSSALMWLAFGGATAAGLALLGGGLAEASLLRAGTPPDQIGAELLPYRAVAIAGLGLIGLSALTQLLNLFVLFTTAEPEEYVVGGGSAAAASHQA